MSMADRDGLIWYDGKLVPWRDATTHVLTHSLHYGLAVFEGVRAYKTERGPAIFRLKEHTERLFNSAQIFMMEIPYSREQLIEAQREVVRANKLESCYLRPLAFYGSEKMGVSPKGAAVHVAIAAWPWGAYLGDEGLKSGIRVKTSSFPRHHINVTMVRGKTAGHYANSILANQEALQRRLRRGAAARHARLRRRGRRREHLHRQGRQGVRARAGVGADRHHARTVIDLARDLGIRSRRADHARRRLHRRRGVLHRHRRRGDADPRARRPRDRRRPARPDHRDRSRTLFFDVVNGRAPKYHHWLTLV